MRFLIFSLIGILFALSPSNVWAITCQLNSSQDPLGNQIHDYSAPENPTDKAVLVMPPTGGENIADRNVARTLCARGLNTIIFNYTQRSGVVLDFSVHDEDTENVLGSLNGFLQARSEKRFVVVGASLGSLYSSLALSLGQGTPGALASGHSEDWPALRKLKGAVLTVSGGSLAEILTDSQIPSVKTQVQERMHSFSIPNRQKYLERMRASIHLDTLQLACASLRERVFLFQSNTDVIVPANTQVNLWQAYGRPERAIFATDHMWSIAWVYFFRTDTIFTKAQKFFNDSP